MLETIRASLFIRKKRFRKKMRMNIMGLKVLFDLTTILYSLILVAYLIAAVFITNDYVKASYNFFIMLEEGARNNFWFILAILPIRYIIQSFQQPGIIFTTSEDKLSMMPYARGKVWLFSAVVKGMRNLVVYIFIGGLIGFVTPISSALISAYITVLFGYDILFMVPTWKLFQERIRIKLAALGGFLFISAILFLLEFPFIGLLIPLILIALHVLLIPVLFKNINWGRVTEISDYRMWNMPLISRATQSSFKRSKRYSTFRQSKRRKKPFSYTHKSIHHRMWFLYLGKNIKLVLQIMGVLLLLLTALAFVSDLYFHIGIAISLYAYINVCASFYRDRFQTDILRVLPWELPIYKHTFLKWVIYGTMVLFLPIVIYGIMHWSVWVPVEWILYMCVFLYMYHMKLDKTITVLSKRLLSFEVDGILGFLFLVLIVASSFNPAFSTGLVACGFVSRIRKKHFNTLYERRGDPVT